MRRRGEAIEVRLGRVGDDEGPSQFLWRSRLWRVLELQSRWMEAEAWWEHALTDEAGRGEGLLREREVWRVEAANGEFFSRGIYELVHAQGEDSWWLRAVVD